MVLYFIPAHRDLIKKDAEGNAINGSDTAAGEDESNVDEEMLDDDDEEEDDDGDAESNAEQAQKADAMAKRCERVFGEDPDPLGECGTSSALKKKLRQETEKQRKEGLKESNKEDDEEEDLAALAASMGKGKRSSEANPSSVSEDVPVATSNGSNNNSEVLTVEQERRRRMRNLKDQLALAEAEMKRKDGRDDAAAAHSTIKSIIKRVEYVDSLEFKPTVYEQLEKMEDAVKGWVGEIPVLPTQTADFCVDMMKLLSDRGRLESVTGLGAIATKSDEAEKVLALASSTHEQKMRAKNALSESIREKKAYDKNKWIKEGFYVMCGSIDSFLVMCKSAGPMCQVGIVDKIPTTEHEFRMFVLQCELWRSIRREFYFHGEKFIDSMSDLKDLEGPLVAVLRRAFKSGSSLGRSVAVRAVALSYVMPSAHMGGMDPSDMCASLFQIAADDHGLSVAGCDAKFKSYESAEELALLINNLGVLPKRKPSEEAEEEEEDDDEEEVLYGPRLGKIEFAVPKVNVAIPMEADADDYGEDDEDGETPPKVEVPTTIDAEDYSCMMKNLLSAAFVSFCYRTRSIAVRTLAKVFSSDLRTSDGKKVKTSKEDPSDAKMIKFVEQSISKGSGRSTPAAFYSLVSELSAICTDPEKSHMACRHTITVNDLRDAACLSFAMQCFFKVSDPASESDFIKEASNAVPCFANIVFISRKRDVVIKPRFGECLSALTRNRNFIVDFKDSDSEDFGFGTTANAPPKRRGGSARSKASSRGAADDDDEEDTDTDSQGDLPPVEIRRKYKKGAIIPGFTHAADVEDQEIEDSDDDDDSYHASDGELAEETYMVKRSKVEKKLHKSKKKKRKNRDSDEEEEEEEESDEADSESSISSDADSDDGEDSEGSDNDDDDDDDEDESVCEGDTPVDANFSVARTNRRRITRGFAKANPDAKKIVGKFHKFAKSDKGDNFMSGVETVTAHFSEPEEEEDMSEIEDKTSNLCRSAMRDLKKRVKNKDDPDRFSRENRFKRPNNGKNRTKNAVAKTAELRKEDLQPKKKIKYAIIEDDDDDEL